jgi:hypothetical protein
MTSSEGSCPHEEIDVVLAGREHDSVVYSSDVGMFESLSQR